MYVGVGVKIVTLFVMLTSAPPSDPHHPLPQNGNSALMCAALNGHSAVCTALLDTGVMLELVNKVLLEEWRGVRVSCGL